MSSLPLPARADPSPMRTIGLQEVARWAAKEPPTVQAAERRVEAAEARVARARAAYAPTIGTEADFDLIRQQQLLIVPDAPNQTTNAVSTRGSTSAKLDWLLFDFQGRKAFVQQAEQLRNGERQAAVRTEFASVRLASEFYVALLTTQRLRDNAAFSSARRAAISVAIARLIEAGLRPRVDLQRAEVEALAARAELSVLSARTAAQSASLRAAMGLDPAAPIAAAELDETLLDSRLEEDEVVARALRDRPELAAQRARIEERRAAAVVARAARLPSLHLSAGASLQHDKLLRGDSVDGNSFALNGGLSVRWSALDVPTFRGLPVVDAELELELTIFREALLSTRTAALVAKRQVVTAGEALRQAGQILEAARIARDAQNRRYQAGEASLLELLDAEQTEQDARSRRILAQRDLELARIALLDALGALEQRLLG